MVKTKCKRKSTFVHKDLYVLIVLLVAKGVSCLLVNHDRQFAGGERGIISKLSSGCPMWHAIEKRTLFSSVGEDVLDQMQGQGETACHGNHGRPQRSVLAQCADEAPSYP